MKLSEQVITLEQARKIKELGFERESYVVHQDYYSKGIYRLENKDRSDNAGIIYPAYTASELMDILPEIIKIYSRDYVEGIDKEFRGYNVVYYEKSLYIQKNLAQALGDMLIYLLENNLLPNKDT